MSRGFRNLLRISESTTDGGGGHGRLRGDHRVQRRGSVAADLPPATRSRSPGGEAPQMGAVTKAAEPEAPAPAAPAAPAVPGTSPGEAQMEARAQSALATKRVVPEDSHGAAVWRNLRVLGQHRAKKLGPLSTAASSGIATTTNSLVWATGPSIAACSTTPASTCRPS